MMLLLLLLVLLLSAHGRSPHVADFGAASLQAHANNPSVRDNRLSNTI